MKKRKIKLLASITSLVLVVAVMAVGVWAATSASIAITGVVNYTATSVIGKVEIKSGEQATLKTVTIAGDDCKSAFVELASWDGTETNTAAALASKALAVGLQENSASGVIATTDTFTIVLKITNESTEANMTYAVTQTAASVETTYIMSITSGTGTLDADTTSVEITITFTPVAQISAGLSNVAIPGISIALAAASRA